MIFFKKISTYALVLLFSSSFINIANADSISSVMLDTQYNNRQAITKYTIETDEDKLFDLAKNNENAITIDENGYEVYRFTQVEEVSFSKNGEKIQTLSEISFNKVEDKDEVNGRTSLTETGWDKTSSAYTSSTINYTITGNYIKLNSCSGSVSQLNSGVTVQNLTVTFGCSAPTVGTQRETKNYGTAKSFSYTPPSSWKQVPNMIGGITGSTVGSSMSVKLGRSSSSTWTQTFTNNIGFFSNN
ncbi:MAG: hypothetical protein ACRCX2_28845 [Paraclostridium sp.]